MIELEVVAADRQGRSAPENDLASALQWRSWADGLEEAREQQAPIFCVAESPWGNAAQRLALFLERDAELADIISDGFVPVLVDPTAMPDLADRILTVAMQVESTVSPPLLAVCTEEGLPLVTSCDITFEGTDERPSLASLLKTTLDQYATARKECLVEARGLQQLEPHAAGGASMFLPVWQLLRQPDDGLLEALLAAGIHDQLAGGFHRASRQPEWGVPHFEKLGVQNAGMAAVLARSGLPGHSAAAQACAEFALRSLRAGSAGLASDTAFYTWASDEILSSLPAEELQMVGLHFRISASSSRHVLNQVRSVGQSVELATGQNAALARQRLAAGKERLLAQRSARVHPAPLGAPEPAVKFTTIRLLLEAARHDRNVVDGMELLEQFHELLGGIDLTHGGLQRPDGSRWIHDQVAALAAVRAAARFSGSGLEQFDRQFSAALERDFRGQGSWLLSPAGPVMTAGWFDGDLPAVQLELRGLLSAAQRM